MSYIKLSRIVRSAAPFVVGLAVLLNSAHAREVTTAKSKPAVYTHIIRENDPHDKAVENAYAEKFTIVEVRDNKQFTSAVLKDCIHPRPELNGMVKVEMIVTSDGRVVEPFVSESVDSRLNIAALDAVRQWRFAPARLNGSPVSETCFAVLGKGKEAASPERITVVEALRKDLLLVAVRPELPTSYAGNWGGAKWHHGPFKGIFELRFDYETGHLREVHVVQSTGDAKFDGRAIGALKLWKAKPRSIHTLVVPITFK